MYSLVAVEANDSSTLVGFKLLIVPKSNASTHVISVIKAFII